MRPTDSDNRPLSLQVALTFQLIEKSLKEFELNSEDLMEIDDLRIPKNAQFYPLPKALSKSSINKLFKKLCENKVGGYLLKEVKTELNIDGSIVFYSFMAFKFETEPSFLEGTTIRESHYAYILLVEYDSYLAVFKKHIDQLEKHLSLLSKSSDYDRFCHFMAGSSPHYEKIGMQNMSISESVIRHKTLEAYSLNGIMSATIAQRAIPTSIRMRSAEDVYTITPSTSRLSKKDKKEAHIGILRWCISVITEIRNNTSKSPFINYFAKPIDLETIKAVCKPVSVLFHLEDLDQAVRGDAAEKKILKRSAGGGQFEELTEVEIKRFFSFFRSNHPIVDNNNEYFIRAKGVTKGTQIGKVRLHKKEISITSKYLESIVIADEDENYISVLKYLSMNKPFSVVFDKPQFFYFSKYTFEDTRLVGNVDGILSILIDSHDFSRVESEKEKPHAAGITEFPTKSLFKEVEDQVCAAADIVLCDDMGDEWADHISLITGKNPPEIWFIHSKYIDKVSMGASNFHEVVAQAQKNLGRLNADLDEFKVKFDQKWCENYERTNIARSRKGHTWPDVKAALTTIFQNPNSVKRVVLATPFISKTAIATHFTTLKRTGAAEPHIVQLLWLLNTFISACIESGASPYILCKP